MGSCYLHNSQTKTIKTRFYACMTKYFALVDCNNFYVSCERVFRPDLENKPVVVLSNNDGVVVSRSDEVKKLEIAMGSPYFQSRKQLQKLGTAIFSSNYSLYGDFSQRIMNILAGFTENLEIYSIDEAFLDLEEESLKKLNSLVKEIRLTIQKQVGIPISIGVAPTKTLAKAANEFAKKEYRHRFFEGRKSSYGGVFVLPATDEHLRKQLLLRIEVNNIWGVGRQYSKMLKLNKIHTALDLASADYEWVKKKMTIQGSRTVRELNGISCIDLEEVLSKKKTILSSRSFGRPVTELIEIKQALATYVSIAAEKLRNQDSAASYLTVFLAAGRYDSFHRRFFSRGTCLPAQTIYTPDLIRVSCRLAENIFQPGLRYKKVGVLLSGLVSVDKIQTHLFALEPDPKKEKVMQVVDKLNRLYGRNTVKLAAQGLSKPWKMKAELRSPKYTTSWEELLEIR